MAAVSHFPYPNYFITKVHMSVWLMEDILYNQVDYQI
jgi:hypothetical protein